MDNEIIQNYIIAIVSLLGVIFTYFHDKADEEDVQVDNKKENRDSVIASSEKVVNTALLLLEPLEKQIKNALKDLESCREYKALYEELQVAHSKLVAAYTILEKSYEELKALGN